MTVAPQPLNLNYFLNSSGYFESTITFELNHVILDYIDSKIREIPRLWSIKGTLEELVSR